MAIAQVESYWAYASIDQPCYSKQYLSATISTCMQFDHMVSLDYQDSVKIKKLASQAVELFQIDAFEILLQARFCFLARNLPVANELSEVLAAARSFTCSTNEPSQTGTSVSTVDIFKKWKDGTYAKKIADGSMTPDYQDWLSGLVIPELNAFFG